MKCQEVEPVITDLARNGTLEIDVREGALAHIGQCRACSERLVEEKRLTAGLRAWAGASISEQAPARVEGKLLAAFRGHLVHASPPRRRWVKIATAGSIAAAVLLFKLLTPEPPPPAPVTVVPMPQTPAATMAAVTVPPPKVVRRKRQATRPARPAPLVERAEFLPVAQDDGWTPLEGGRLVRVGLPRSAMRVFGFPVNEGRGAERVQADVMLSNDGVLRAIRFVR